MAIVSISRGSNSRGTEVAELVAERLGYECVAREALLEASDLYNIPRDELLRAIEDPPSLLERLWKGKARYVATIRATVLRRLCADNIVYHGFAGHFFVRDISHALKVRILAEESDRVATAVEREGISAGEARQRLLEQDKARRQLAIHLYGTDAEDPSLYDLVLHVGKMGTDGAANVICDLIRQDIFVTTPASQAALADLALAASVEAVLIDMDLDLSKMRVTADRGVVVVRLEKAPRTHAGSGSQFREHYMDSLGPHLRERVAGLPGLKKLNLQHSKD
ncbi:MAG: cytidylate kinase-like family protein [bacterium]